MLTSRRLERARRRGVLGEGLAVGEEDHESACKLQHRTGECQPRARQCALNSRCSGFERAMQAPSQAGRGLRGPSAWMSRELEHLGVPVPLVRQNFFRCTSSSQKQGRTMAGAAMAAVVRRLAAAHARGRARTPVLAKLGKKPVARPARLHRSPGRGSRPMATPELSAFFWHFQCSRYKIASFKTHVTVHCIM